MPCNFASRSSSSSSSSASSSSPLTLLSASTSSSSSFRPTIAPSKSYIARRTICGCSRAPLLGSFRTTKSHICSPVNVESVSCESASGEGRVDKRYERARIAEVRRKAGSSAGSDDDVGVLVPEEAG